MGNNLANNALTIVSMHDVNILVTYLVSNGMFGMDSLHCYVHLTNNNCDSD